MHVLASRSDMTGADRTWAARYSVGDVLYYPRGSQDIGIEKQSYTKVIATQPQDDVLTVQKADGVQVTYNPARLYGGNVYRELEHEFAVGDRLSLTAPSKELGVANRDLGSVQQIDKQPAHRQNGQRQISELRTQSDETFRPRTCRHESQLPRTHRGTGDSESR